MLIAAGVLAAVFYVMSPETNGGSSMFSEATFIVLGIFFAVSIVRIAVAARRKNTGNKNSK